MSVDTESPRRRRWPKVLAVVLVLGAVLAAATWWVVLPTYRPSLQEGETYGIDVSNHQGDINWEKVANDDISFAYIKATEGKDFSDARFDDNWAGAGAAGLERGAYHFFTLCSPGADQANHFVEALRRVQATTEDSLPPAVDLELAGNCRQRPSYADVQTELGAFLDIVEEASGQEMLLYVGDDWEREFPVRRLLDRPLWHFRFLQRPNVEGWTVWQIQGFAYVEGVNGRVDLNVMRPAP